ncbi:manganese efflux pump MntP family protein [Salsuginibacillus kocurii]|uniref:manganese efflux pump MntP n=1 Tax=Salsuginibacillus kocurii TaxID=427078 RepID=UPI000367CCD7|nr:manganese efflux pump [Salsuginibacillus kocurii]
MTEWTGTGLLALALGMDAFSVSLALGMKQRSKNAIWFAAAMVGAFHMLMPVIGIAGGHYLADVFGQGALWAGALLLVAIGVHMLLEANQPNTSPWYSLSGAGIVVFAFIVSLDSLSAGMTLGIVGVHLWIVLLLFGLMSALCTLVGLVGARIFHKKYGVIGECVGGLILLFFGLKMAAELILT